MALRQLQGEQVAALTARERAGLPYVAPMAQAQLAEAQARTPLVQAQTTHANLVSQEAALLLPMRAEELRARIDAQVSAGSLDKVRADELKALSGTNLELAKQRLAEATINARGYTVPNAAVPGGSFQITGGALPGYLGSEARLSQAIQHYQTATADAERRAAAAADKTDAEREKEAASIEALLMKPATSAGKPLQPADVVPYTTSFAANSTGPYAYVPLDKNAKTGQYTNYGKYKLPLMTIPGLKEPVQMSARDLYLLSRDATMTPREFLDWYYTTRLKTLPPWQGR